MNQYHLIVIVQVMVFLIIMNQLYQHQFLMLFDVQIDWLINYLRQHQSLQYLYRLLHVNMKTLYILTA